jgi:hypothetical protein
MKLFNVAFRLFGETLLFGLRLELRPLENFSLVVLETGQFRFG